MYKTAHNDSACHTDGLHEPATTMLQPTNRNSRMRLVASLALALLLLAGLISRDVSALAPPLPWRQKGPMVSSSLSMVSQKEKRRRQDGAKRREAYEELQVAQAQTALVVQLQGLQSNKRATTATKKLLKNAQHDGLNDIGMEARLLALEIFYKGERPSDMVELIAKNDDRLPRNVCQFGFWAHSKLGDWPSAATFAGQLYNLEIGKDLSSENATDAFSGPTEQHQLRLYAVQAFANTDQHMERAVELLTEDLLEATSESALAMTASVNAVLRSYVRNGKLQDFKSLFHKVRQQTQTAKLQLLDHESYQLALDCAAQLGDIELMEQVLANKVNIQQSASDKVTLRTRILETLSKTMATGTKLSSHHQTLAKETLQSSKDDINPETLSQILLALDNDSDLEDVLQSFRRRRNSSNNKGYSSWHVSLSVPAKVHILPSLYKLETPPMANYTRGGDAWKVFTALVKTDKKTGAITQRSRKFLRTQQCDKFCWIALFLADWERNQLELCQVILQECWETILSVHDPLLESYGDQPIPENVRYIMEMIQDLPSESARIQLFVNILSTFSANEEADKIGTLPSFSNEKLTLIVQSSVRWLRVIAIILANSTSSSDSDGNSETERFRKLASLVSEEAMRLVSTLDDFSSEHYWDYGPSDNGAKEALQTIMKELLQSNLLADDNELVRSACCYYLSLARVSQSSSVIGYNELLFPVSVRGAIDMYKDPFENFRSCVLGKNERKEEWSTRLVNFAVSMLDGEEDGDLSLLLSSVVSMTLKLDERTGSISYDAFVLAYKRYFIDWRSDLFFDRQLLCDLCSDLRIQGLLPSRDAALLLAPAALLLTPDFAAAMIKRLRECRDARYWIVEKMRKMDTRLMINASAKYLVNLYAQVDVFDSIFDNEKNSKSLGEAYIDACGINCAFIVKAILSAGKSKTKVLDGRRGRSSSQKTSELARPHVAMTEMFIAISDAITDIEKKNDEDFDTSDYEILLEHTLNTFSNVLPAFPSDSEIESLLSKLRPEIKDYIRDWIDRQTEVEEKDASQ